MSTEAVMTGVSSRWITDLHRQLMRRKHVVLYGNVHDQFLREKKYDTVHNILDAYFRDQGFELLVRYDVVEGLRFLEDSQRRPNERPGAPLPQGMKARFDELHRRGVVARQGGVIGSGAPDPVATSFSLNSGDPTQPPTPAAPGSIVQESAAPAVPPEQAFAQLRIVLSQAESSTAAIVDLGDMLATDPKRFSTPELNLVALLKKCTLEAAVIPRGRLAGHRNALVIVAGDLNRVPEWFYRDNPFVSLIEAARPTKDERRQFAMQFVKPSGDSPGFKGGDRISKEDLPLLADEFADLTQGLQAIDLEALRHTSWQGNQPVQPGRVQRLVDYFKFGMPDDPWEKLNADRIRNAKSELSASVIGQENAVEAVVTMLTNARVGLTLTGAGPSGAPKGVFFFVGPTGVGKTELAKAVTKLVFGDEKAFARFDMSEYMEQHAAEKLAGAPPGFVGYEEGGQLTNRVMQQPHSILLFDEIEKAHPKVLDKFLQILEDGRLTDGKGQTAYFHHTAIIFTSNIGAKEIMQAVRADGLQKWGLEEVDGHFRRAVEAKFADINRPELFNRLSGSIVPFDLLREAFIEAIGRKFIRLMQASATERFQLTVQVDEDTWLPFLKSQMQIPENQALGGRRIKAMTQEHLINALNKWIFDEVRDTSECRGRTVRVEMTPKGVCARFV